MNQLILHHYPESPYSEKLRNVLGFKKLGWRSVITPRVLPKPDLMPLTGGYRKAPVLQIGRDVYCDTSLMLRVIERLHPDPPLLPAAHRASCAAFARLEQDLFFCAIPVVFQPAGLKVMMERLGGAAAMEQFSKDRAALFSGGSAQRPSPEFSRARLLPLLNSLDTQLAAAPFLLGEDPTLADFSMYHPVWFILSNAGVAETLAPFRNLQVWAERMRALGHGQAEPMSAQEALDEARGTSSVQPFDGPQQVPDGVTIGQPVTVHATDYGVDPVSGILLHASVFELVVKRSDERAGEVNVHVPRAGFRVTPA